MAHTQIRHEPSVSALSRLLGWKPLWALGGLIVVVAVVPTYQNFMNRAHLAPGGVTIETEGASAKASNGRLEITLPVDVYNGTDARITDITLWVEVLACPEADSPARQCQRVTDLQQSVTGIVAPGGSLHASPTRTVNLRDDWANSHFRVVRKVQDVSEESDPALGLRDDISVNPHEKD